MKVVNLCAGAFVLGLIALALIGGVEAAGTKPAIFVANSDHVTAYPIGTRGDVVPIALTTDMAAPSGIARDASGRIYVSNSATNTITVYAANASGNVPPVVVLGGSNTRLAGPIGIALDASGKIYVLNRAGNRKGASITVYPPLAFLPQGTTILNDAPVAAIAGSKTLLDDPTGIAIDSGNNIYVANEFGGPKVPHQSSDRGRVTVYPAGSSGNIAPIATIRGAATGLAIPAGIAVDSSGNIYVANLATAGSASNGGSITVYPADSNGNASPSAIIAGDNTGLLDPRGIALDSGRNLYVPVILSCAGLCGGTEFAVNVYPLASNGNVLPSAVIAGADTGLAGSDGLALDSIGNLYVLNGNGGPADGGSLTVFGTGTSGDALPTSTITSNFTGIEFASSIAMGSIGNIYVTNSSGGVDNNGSIAIYAAGSHATGPPLATIKGANTGLSSPSKIAVDPRGNMSVLNFDGPITVYPAGSSGDVPPTATLNIGGSGKDTPNGIAVDPRGDLYVANQGRTNCNKRSCRQTSPDSVAVYPTGSDGDAKPSAVITGPNTNLATPSAIAVDRGGGIYVTNQGPVQCVRGCGRCIPIPSGAGSVSVYASGSSGNARPVATITGANTGLRFPFAIALDSNGNIYVLNDTFAGFACVGVADSERTPTVQASNVEKKFLDPILIFAAGSNGDVAPIGGIGGPFTGLNFPAGIAIGPGSP